MNGSPRYLFVALSGIGLWAFVFVMGLWMVDVAYGAAGMGTLTTNGRMVFSPDVTFHFGLYLLMASFFVGVFSIGLLVTKYVDLKARMAVDGR